ncbi:MAG: hypothetical protein IBX72_02955 [Nitrospirae bacterium]|nr:hypothetical protein [Nitrospirota bacterium]
MSVIYFLFLIIFILLFSFACEEKPGTAFDDYGDALIDSYNRGQKAGEIANLDAVKKAVSMYYAENAKYPETLEKINDYMRSDIDMSKYNYDPDTGKVSLKE